MDLLQLLLVVALVGRGGGAWCSAPLRRAAATRTTQPMTGPGERDALEAAREAKYREIREAELDMRTGKLARRGLARRSTAACAPRRWRCCAPWMAWKPSRSRADRGRTAPPTRYDRAVELALSVLQVAVSVALIFLVLMHSGKDAGLSGAFGVGSGAGPLGGGSLVERNLNRWTIAFAIVFVVNTIVLLKL